MRYLNSGYICLLFIFLSAGSAAQRPASDTASYKTIIAEPAFQKKSNFYQWLWGRNRRVEWATPIRVSVVWLDTLRGGLKPYLTGGGNETKSLRLQTATGKEYVLRSVNKSRNDVIPPYFKNTFIADIIKDGISTSHPYGGLALSGMQEQAGIYHTLPIVVYLPKQAALDTFNNKYGNDLYFFEQRPDGNWNEAANLGRFKDFSSTDNVIKKLQESNRYQADQFAFAKARLFDMLIGDWDRHEDNWRWGKSVTAGKTLYIPVSRDRDQAFYTHNGVLLNRILRATGLLYMQNFDYTARNMKFLNMEEKNMDRFFTNDLDLKDWVNTAKSLQQSLTDAVIEESIQQLPPEIFAVCGRELIEKLKSRREQLVDLASEYYLFIARQVEVIGSRDREYFEVKREASGETAVSVYRINSQSRKEDEAYYKRTFNSIDTREIRIYGIGGEDIYSVKGPSSAIIVRIIGGAGKDSILQSGSNIQVYDDQNNIFQTSSARLHLSSRSEIHAFKYESFRYDSVGSAPLFIGFSYGLRKFKWRREPFAVQHAISASYSISTHAVNASYGVLYPNRIGHWDVFLKGNWEAVRTSFYGLGNETVATEKKIEYYRMRSREWVAVTGLRHSFGKSTIELNGFYQHVSIRDDTGRYAAKVFQLQDPDVFAPNQYVGGRFIYTYASVDNPIVPTNGIALIATGVYVNNFTQKDFFQNYSAKVQSWLALGPKFSLAVKAGAATIVGHTTTLKNAQVYQHVVIGGPESLRGYRTERFWGKSSFYNNNELRFITNLRTYLLNAKVGLIAFFDDGRVWMPGENSTLLHTSYGGGILLSPFHQICITVTYGISNEARLTQIRFNTLF